ncbi:MAG: TolC family protein [Thermodesulfobacteriota bacterium]
MKRSDAMRVLVTPACLIALAVLVPAAGRSQAPAASLALEQALVLPVAGGVTLMPPVVLSLEEAYHLAGASHEQIVIARQELDKSRLKPDQARSIMLPHAKVDGDYRHLDDDMTRTTQSHLAVPGLGIDQDILVGPTLVAREDQLSTTFSVQQALYQGEYFPLRRAAGHTIDHSREALQETVQEVLFSVATVFYRCVTAKALVATAGQLLDLARKDLAVAQTKVQAGKLTEDAAYRARLSVTRTEAQRLSAQHQLVLARDLLARLTGRSTPVADVVEPAPLLPRGDDLESLLAIAQANRYDFRRAALRVQLAEDELALAKAKSHPSLGAEWRYTWFDREPPTLDKEFWAAMVRLSVPLVEGGARLAEEEEKAISLQQARTAQLDLEKRIRLEVVEAFLGVGNQEAVLANAQQQVEAAAKSHEIVTARYDFGAATSLDYDQAYTALQAARNSLVTETYAYQLALLKLEKAIGLFGRDEVEALMAQQGETRP